MDELVGLIQNIQKVNKYLSSIILISVLVKCTNISVSNNVKLDCILKNSDVYYTLGEDLNELDFTKCGHIIDTIFEDEEIEWKVKTLRTNNQDLIYFETNYNDSQKISRITLKSSLNLSDDLGIGLPQDYFMRIKDKINDERLNEGADGYLFLINRKYPNISYELDLPFDSPLTFGITSLNQIPDSTLVKSIIFKSNY